MIAGKLPLQEIRNPNTEFRPAATARPRGEKKSAHGKNFADLVVQCCFEFRYLDFLRVSVFRFRISWLILE